MCPRRVCNAVVPAGGVADNEVVSNEAWPVGPTDQHLPDFCLFVFEFVYLYPDTNTNSNVSLHRVAILG